MSASTDPQDPSNENTLFAAIKHTRQEIDEARRLYDQKLTLLTPPDQAWITRVISETENAANSISRLLEPARIERETRAGKLSVATRLRWALGDGQRVRDQYAHMNICHQSLVTAIAFLHNRAPIPVVIGSWGQPAHPLEEEQWPTSAPPAYDLNQVLTWRGSKSWRRVQPPKKKVVELE
ncbi:hypothetical protein N7466_006071 [Penicillium verhagenii]|uniref:uncharacterized protein n=1 Tax=Penicillium verhagenii TaxID=1562060 RepID=UPI0025454C17|nr:uncharacterized protein N7466_006071 [Penicillium verhagenii]KAJ5930578.1 hypothetical protein N7466_006071 [Penicillium verhagenii]